MNERRHKEDPVDVCQGPANRLIHEKSPYLRQHAHNPVDWYPWGEEAFDKARREDRPVFLSVGYSTCHWCHVMERESFEDPEVAQLLNEAFVCIKVDREERPDIDKVYMAVCQMLTGGGGWPLTVVMTPEKEPFFAGTYFPKEGRLRHVGMVDLIPRVRGLWLEQREAVVRSAAKIVQVLRAETGEGERRQLGEADLGAAHKDLAQRFDESHGGFGPAPKFPMAHGLLFLLRYWRRTGDESALRMVERTLDAMRSGGIYDHVGFGFHRYSTDEAWFLPHFEKMLYDQAMLAMAYVEAFQATGKGRYARTAREIFTYVLRDMTAPEGAFFSAEDAESEGVEGRFYVWTVEEVRSLVGEGEADLAARVFGLETAGNFRDEATGARTGANIVHLKRPIEGLALALATPEPDLRDRVEEVRRRLFTARAARVRPHRDEKVLADWNGLMIAALAKAAGALGAPEYAAAAVKAADFILKHMRDPSGRLLHRYCDGEAAIAAPLDDYAFLTWGLIELYEATFEARFLRSALAINSVALARFWDSRAGGFFFTPDDSEGLLVRHKEAHDGAVPSGNGVAMLNLLRLGRMTADAGLEKRAGQVATAFSDEVAQLPSAYTQLMIAFDFALGPSCEVVVVGRPLADDTRAMVQALKGVFAPRRVMLFRPIGEGSHEIDGLAGFTEGLAGANEGALCYVCRDYHCELPTADIGEILRMVGAGGGGDQALV